jgi:hypothetical protein
MLGKVPKPLKLTSVTSRAHQWSLLASHIVSKHRFANSDTYSKSSMLSLHLIYVSSISPILFSLTGSRPRGNAPRGLSPQVLIDRLMTVHRLHAPQQLQEDDYEAVHVALTTRETHICTTWGFPLVLGIERTDIVRLVLMGAHL